MAKKNKAEIKEVEPVAVEKDAQSIKELIESLRAAFLEIDRGVREIDLSVIEAIENLNTLKKLDTFITKAIKENKKK